MATIEDYTSGKVCQQIKLAFFIFNTTEGTFDGTDIGRVLLSAVEKFEPRKLSVEEASFHRPYAMIAILTP